MLDLLNGTHPQREGEHRDLSAELADLLSPDLEPEQQKNRSGNIFGVTFLTFQVPV